MPHTRVPPKTVDEILATSHPDPEWIEILEDQPIPKGFDYGDVETIKQISEGTYPRLRASLDAVRPSGITELDVYADIPVTDLKPEATRNRILISHPDMATNKATDWPVIILIHGGGHTVGNPESELPLARRLVLEFNALVIMPSYRLAPQHTYPSSINDCFETLKQVAADVTLLSTNSVDQSSSNPNILLSILADRLSPASGFILGGTSAGGTISASVSHLYRAHRTSTSASAPLPPLTGLLLSCASNVSPITVPTAYKPYYHSHTQNDACLPLDLSLWNLFESSIKPDYHSPLWSSLDQHPELKRDRVGEDHVFLKEGNVRVYFQVCGQDMMRDNALIYERVLREECGVETRLDLYNGFGHVFWGMGGGYAGMEMSKKRMEHSVEGVGWLLRKEG